MARKDFRFVAATEAHARELAPRMRAADAAEVLASGGLSPLDALLESLRASTWAWAALFDGQLGALFGVAEGPFLMFRAYPWALTSDVVERHQGAFLRACRVVLEAWTEQYPLLEQAVDARYGAALRWAAHLGFQVDPPAPFGVFGLPFCRITLRRDAHV